MARAEAVVFDIGNVLIEWQPERFYDRIMAPADRARMFAEIDLHAMNEAIDKGAPFRETIYATAARHPEWEDKIRLWHDNWIEMASPVIPHSVRLLRALVGQDMYLAGVIILLFSVLTVIGTLVSDILLAVLDPRIRMDGA